MDIRPADFDDAQTLELLRAHLTEMHDCSPPGTDYTLDAFELKDPKIASFAVWDGPTLVGLGALKETSSTTGEIKSMRTHHAHLRRGVAAMMLEHLLELARARGYVKISLETGTGPTFDAAVRMYRKFGFVNGPVFGDYREHPANQFLHLSLQR